ncbi:S9 family peptidase [Bacillus salitolerans]|uniref:S9 family peptidase n=1 Tax=Bacillus salitolerans TaxID=1437434 RepID=A0ABW4LVJ4_9BACI
MIKKRGIKPEDLFKLKSVNCPLYSPSGENFLFVETVMDEEEKKYYSHLFVGNNDGDQIRQWTFGKVRDVNPAWSPDGKWIAFLSNRSEKQQVFVMSASGGEPRQVTDTPNGVSQFGWSPNSKQLLISHLLSSENEEVKSEAKSEQLEPMVVEKLAYKSDASGFFDHKYSKAALVDIHTNKYEPLTTDDVNYSIGCFSPDGKNVVLFANPSDEAEYELITDVYIVNLENKNMERITSSNGQYSQASWSPDGTYLAFIGHEKEYLSATLSRIWLYDLQKSELTCLTENLDVHIGDVAIGDFQQSGSDRGLVWTLDSTGFYFIASDQGSTAVYYGDIEGLMYPVILDDQHVYSFTVDVHKHKVIAGISTHVQPGELFMFDLHTGEKKQLTNVNKVFLEGIDIVAAEAFRFKAQDGWDIHGWIMKPVGLKEGKKVPLVVEIHGGPHMMYANSYFHEFQVLAAKGFAVLFTNPRGSHGYGQTFVDAVRGDYGGKDYLDIMSAVDYVLENYDFIDEARLGVTGGSYGGFMTNWIVGHTDRFKAAVTQRSICNWISFYGVSDIGYFFTQWEVLRGEAFDVEKLWNVSPLKYIDNMRTPLLILHSEKDYRCPIEQAEQLYVSLKHQKKQTKLVRFPEANHELSRSGDLSLRLHRLNHIVNWFDNYL